MREYLVLWIALLRGLTDSTDVSWKPVAYIFSAYITRRHTPTNLNLEIRNVCIALTLYGSGVSRNFVRGVQQMQLTTEDRENGDLGGSGPLVRGSGGSCNLVQEISFHTVKFS